MIIETQVEATFSASHKDRTSGNLHGHSYLVTASFLYKGGDARHPLDMLRDEVKSLDHATLPDNLSWAEEIAAYLLGVLPDCNRVRVSRPLEGLHAEARKD